MKKILTIVFLFTLFQSFGQDDSLLQRLIDSAKTQQQVNPAPVATDTQKPVVKPIVKQKDTFRPAPFYGDSLLHQDSLVTSHPDTAQKDSLIIAPITAPSGSIPWLQDTAFIRLLSVATANVKAKAVSGEGELKKLSSKDFLFYLLVGVVLLLAITRQLFPKYFQNLMRLFFEASFRQKQRREQLMQENLPSLLMNILFIIVSGLFIALLAEQNKWINISFWRLSVYSITLLAFIYLFKYAVIQFTGWIFNAKEPASTYSFIVFLVNKIIALALLPLLWLLAFSGGYIREVTVAVAACIVIFLLLFRYIVSLTIIRSTLSVQPLHFFIYLCAVELMPMLIIYKFLFQYTGKGGN